MKHPVLLACLILSLTSTAQKTNLFFDYRWKPCSPVDARFFTVIEKTDSGWLRLDHFMGNNTLQMQALYADSACTIQNGSCYYFYANGYASAIGRVLNNKEEGIYTRYHSNGMIADSALYQHGKPVDSRIKWYRNGYMSDSIYHANDSMDIQISWFDDGAISAAGYLLNGKLNGKWKYYHRNGSLSGEVIYLKDSTLSSTYFNEDGSPATDDKKANKPAHFKNGGEEGWKKFLAKNLTWPGQYEFTNGTLAVVLVGMTIDELGKVGEVEVLVPFHPEFDKIALKAVSNSPAWLPAMAHNRTVKNRISQPVVFVFDDGTKSQGR